ncbi:lipopolysaccharide assembly protein LapB [Microbacterium sp. SMR1]|uniref:tetratricopeptide repeat protein n=1 Tax=Microbacterium sp. SMR1 TaxID=1497340 RepID=UPI0011BE2494|nr:hypothetical protein [Microbacterium sp. SMR1]
MPEWLSALLGPGLWFGKWVTYEMRVVRIVRKRAREHGLELNTRALRMHLYARHFLEKMRDDAARPALRDSLDAFTADSSVTSDQLFSWIEQAATDRADAVVASNTNAASVRERIDSVKDAVVTSDHDRTLRETRLTGMRPSRALAAREAQQVWPRLDTVLGLLDGPDRSARLNGWAHREPQFLSDAPAQVWCWLADLADDAGAASSAAVFLDKALTLGAHPLGYWEIRREWLRRSERDIHSQPSHQSTQKSPSDTEHALVKGWQLELKGDTDQARDVLEAWDPRTAAETATRSLLLARFAANQNDHAEAVRLALPLFEETGSPAAVIIAAQSLVAQQLFESTALHAGNTADAFALLIKARDLFRQWQVDSVNVIVLAATIARLLNDPLRALSLITAEPNGEATPMEAASLKIRASAALLHADNGDLEQGRALVDEPDLAPATASHLRALIALADEDDEAAARHFESALDLTDDYQEKGTFALALARLGRSHPFAEEQRAAGNAVFAEHLRLIADAASGASGSMDRLQAAAHTSANLSLILSEIYQTQGETEKQALTLEAAAARMNDSDIWLAAARVRWQRDEPDEALHDAEEARANAPHQWGAYPRTYALLVELYSASGIWSKALDAAENLVRVSSNDPLAVWTLISCQYYAGEFELALRTWDTLTDRQRPVRRQLIHVWLGLYEQYGELVGATADLVAIANDWAEDEYIRRRIVGLLIAPRRAPVAKPTDEPRHDQSDDGQQEQRPDGDGGDQDPEQLARAALFSDYFRDFPDGAIKRLEAIDEDDDDTAAGAKLLAQIIDAVGERPDTSEFDAKIFTGVLPVGTVSYAHGCTLAEAVVTHASGVRFSSRGDEFERSVARLALANSVVADTTSLFFLATLPEELRLGLTGVFAGLGVSADQFRDAVSGLSQAERFGYATSITGGMRGPVALRARFTDEASLDVSRLSALVELMRPLVRHERPRTATRDHAEQLKDDTWYAAAAVASDVRALWSDDRTLNILAADFGVRTFSTPALLDVLEEDGRLASDIVRQVRAHLVAERYVHVDFDEDIFARAMTLRPGASMNVASVVEHLDGARAEAKCDFMLSHAAQHTPDGVRMERWISATVRWMIRISPDENAMTSNLALLAGKVLKAPWVVPQTFAYVDAGFADARQNPSRPPGAGSPGGTGSPGPALNLASDEDPLVRELERRFRFVASTDRMLATRWLLALMAGLDASERPRYTAIILRP